MKEFITAATLTAIALSLAAQAAKAQPLPAKAQEPQATRNEAFFVNGKQVTKLAAVRTLIAEPLAVVHRCQEIELSEDAKVKIKKVKKLVSR